MSECNLHCTPVFQYIHPTDAHKLGQAELLVIDEAAAIPLPYVKSMLGPYLVFLASTINGLVNSTEIRHNLVYDYMWMGVQCSLNHLLNYPIVTISPLEHADSLYATCFNVES